MRVLLSTVSAAAIATCGAASADAASMFNRVASFPVALNLPQGSDPASATSAEIITATADGMMLVYSDSPLGVVGMIDISDPKAPKPAGVIETDGEPTSVVVVGGKVLAGINTSESFTEPSGRLAVIDIASKAIESSCDLGGQPDSVAVSPDASLVAIAIENERDEDVDDGVIPQMPAGFLVILPLADGVPDCDGKKTVDLTGLAEIAPEDPEPEFVDVNSQNEIVVTMQENNHIAIVDGASGSVKAHFSAGSVDLMGIDAEDDGALRFTDAADGVRREPDAVKWLDNSRFVVANEGDYEGGSRSFTIFGEDGTVAHESGLALEYEIARAGHYPDSRSDAKGVEPEGLAAATFGGAPLIFVLSERGSAVGVYRDTGAVPEFVQILSSGVGPEGAVAIPSRNLFATANEADLGEDGLARSHVMIYEYSEGAAVYPQIRSVMEDGVPLGWAALSGLAAHPSEAGTLFAVNDSFFAAQPTIFTIDARTKPATITGAIRVTRGGAAAQKLDIEGIAADGEGGFWLASEGRSDRLIPHALYHVDATGEIDEEIAFPADLLKSEIRFGAEGVAKIGDTLWVAIQREWGDDPKGMVKLLAYNLETKEWGAVHYPLEPAGEGWVGLSEITLHGDHVYIVERDNQIGGKAVLKTLYRVALADLKPAPIGGALPVVAKQEVRDLVPDLKSLGGYVLDKVEGFAVDAAGEGFVVTDNDGVDDSSGETMFFSIGKM